MTSRPKRNARRRIAALTLILGMAAPSPAVATGADDKALAEAFFDEGLKLMKEGQFEAACGKLENSNRIDPGIGTLLYLAECYEKTGRTASAWATFREATSAAQAAGQSDRARTAQERASALEAALSRLTIEASAETRDIPNLTVKRSGKVLEASLWGVPLPIDPGKYSIDVSAPGYEPWSTSVTITPQPTTQTVKIPVLSKLALSAASPQPAAAPALAVSAEPAPRDAELPAAGLSTQQTIGAIVGGLGLVGLGIGSYFGFTAISKNSDAELHCPRGKQCNSPDGVTLTDEAKDAAQISNIAFGAGAALVVSGMVLYFTGSSKKASGTVQVMPIVGTTSAALQLGGAFQ